MGFNVNSIQRQIQPLNRKISFNYRQVQSKTDSNLQPLNPQIGFNIKSIQRQIQPLIPKMIQYQFHSEMDSTIKPTNRI